MLFCPKMWKKLRFWKPNVFFFFFSVEGFRYPRSTTTSQQAHPAAVHWKPRAVHAPPQARQHRGPADEGSGQRGEAAEEDGEVRQLGKYEQSEKRHTSQFKTSCGSQSRPQTD